MAGFKILKTKKIDLPEHNLVTELDPLEALSFKRIENIFGQYKSITVCEKKGRYLIVDGAKHFKSLIGQGFEKILCFNLGKLKKGEYETTRALLNVHQSRLDYLGIAKLIESIRDDDMSLNNISNLSGLDLKSVERYKQLLKFDWEEFDKKTKSEQFNPFESYGEEEE
jgi:hypothetical protein